MRQRRPSLLVAASALLIVSLGAGLRFWGLDFGLPHLGTRPDETPVIDLTAKVAQGRYDVGWGMYPDAYVYLTWIWGELGVALGGALGLLEPGGYLDVLRRDPSSVYLAARTLSALAGLGAVAGLMALARRTSGDAVALVAGGLLATAFLHVRDSHAAKPDALLSLWAVAGLAASVSLAEGATLRRGVLAGLPLGAALATKYPGVLLAVPIYAGALLGARATSWRRLVPGAALAAAGTGLGLFAVTSPFMLAGEEFRAWAVDFARLLFPQVGIAGSGAAQPVLPMDHAPGPSPYGAEAWWGGYAYHARFSLRYGVGLLATLLAPAALIRAFVLRRPVLLIAAAYAVAWYALFGLSGAQLARYMTPLLPALALLEADLAVAAARRFGGRHAAWLAALLAAALVAEPLARSVRHDVVISRTDTRVLAARWMRERLPEGASVAVLGTRFWSWGAPELSPKLRAVRLKEDREILARSGVDYVLTHNHPLFSSTLDRATWSRLQPRTRLLVEFDPFRGAGDGAVFETADAYYVPFAGLDAVTRPGPVVRIYALE